MEVQYLFLSLIIHICYFFIKPSIHCSSNEFTIIEELKKIDDDFNNDINSESNNSTGEAPNKRLLIEKEYLNPLPYKDIIDCCFYKPMLRKVTKESMITFNGNNYS